jgi:hypothetical protein
MDSKKNAESFYDQWDELFTVDQAGTGRSIDAAQSAIGRRNATTVGITPSQYRLSSAVNAVRNDEMVYAATVVKTDAATSRGYYFEGSNKQELQRARNFFEDAKFDATLRHLFFNGVPLGNAFIEVVYDGGGRPLPELYVLETTEMEIIDPDGHGVPIRYKQGNAAGDVYFTPEQVVHFRFDRFTTSLWGEIPIKPVDQLVGIKMKLKSHIWRMFNHNVFRQKIHFPKGTVDEDLKRSLAEYRQTIKDPDKPYIWFGDGVEHDVLMTFEDGPRFLELMTAIDLRILTLMQVPPIMAGIPDSSGRASGEQQTYKAFNTHIRSLQKYVEDTINFELLPRLGFKSVKFYFNPIDDKSTKDVLEMAVQLKAMGAKPDKLRDWMEEQGISLPKDFFNEDFFMSPTKMDKNQMTNNAGAPSRKGKAEGEGSKKVGTASEGSTRDDQLVTQAFDEVDTAFERLTKGQIRDPVLNKRARELLAQGISP